MAEKKPDLRTGEKPRRFVCLRTCYWNGHRWQGKDRTDLHGGKPAEVDFPSGSTIPTTFQFENWEEI